MSRLLDGKINGQYPFKYSKGADVAKTFARIRRQLAEQKAKDEAALAEQVIKVCKIKREIR